MKPFLILFRWLAAGALSLLIVAAVGAAASRPFYPLTTERLDRERGREIFMLRCASCHAVRRGEPGGIGPSLAGAGRWASQRVRGQSKEEYLFTSIVDPEAFRAPGTTGQMPRTFAEQLSLEDLRHIVTYLSSLGLQPVDYGRVLSLELPPQAARAQPTRVAAPLVEQGRGVFLGRGKCSSCHALDLAPGSELAAPHVNKSGAHGTAFLREAMLEPSKKITSGYETWQLIAGGKPYVGRKLPSPEGQVRLVITDPSGTFTVQEFAASDLEPFEDGKLLRRSEVSSMPSYQGKLTDEELAALLEFLASLR